MQKTLIVLGIALLVAGLAWPWLGAVPFGRLPGDIVIQRGNVRFYFPLTTMVVVSGVLSLLVWFLRR